MTTERPADLAADTAVTPVEKVPGLYLCRLPDHWDYVNPCGGALMTVALRAMQSELADPGLRLLSATTVFAQAVLPGELRVQVHVLRRGDSAAQVRASLEAAAYPGPGLEVIATFARDRDGPDVHGVEMPDVPRPGDAVRTHKRSGPPEEPPFRIFDNLDMAVAIGEPMHRPGWTGGPAHTAYWYRYKVPQVDAAGFLDPLAIPPIADTMPPALVRRLGPDHPRYRMPSLDLTVFFLSPSRTEWILVESFAERARAGYAVGSANIWDEHGQLIARASQTMTLRVRKPRGVTP